jgi:hypothetical protein
MAKIRIPKAENRRKSEIRISGCFGGQVPRVFMAVQDFGFRLSDFRAGLSPRPSYWISDRPCLPAEIAAFALREAPILSSPV